MQVTHERLSILIIYRINSDYDSQLRDSSLQLYLQSTYGRARYFKFSYIFTKFNLLYYFMVAVVGLEPTRFLKPMDFLTTLCYHSHISVLQSGLCLHHILRLRWPVYSLYTFMKQLSIQETLCSKISIQLGVVL